MVESEVMDFYEAHDTLRNFFGRGPDYTGLDSHVWMHGRLVYKLSLLPPQHVAFYEGVMEHGAAPNLAKIYHMEMLASGGMAFVVQERLPDPPGRVRGDAFVFEERPERRPCPYIPVGDDVWKITDRHDLNHAHGRWLDTGHIVRADLHDAQAHPAWDQVSPAHMLAPA